MIIIGDVVGGGDYYRRCSGGRRMGAWEVVMIMDRRCIDRMRMM